MILIVGPTGAGKSVQAKKLEEEFGYKWISMGKLLRQSDDENVQATLARGDLVDDEPTQMVLMQEIENIPLTTKILLDGHPRRSSQAMWLLDYLKTSDRKLLGVINLQVSLEEVLERLEKRGRHDDQRDVVEKRYKLYEEEVLPMLETVREMGVPVHDIDGEQSVEEVYSSVQQALGANNV